MSWVVKMDSGRIAAQGTVEQLRADGQLAEIIKSEAKEERAQEETVEEEAAVLIEKKTEGKTQLASRKKLVEAEKKATYVLRRYRA